VSDDDAGTQVETAYRSLLRRALLAGGAAAVVCAVVFAGTGGRAGLASSLLGSVIVLLFFGLRLLVMRRTARSNPQLVLAVALGVYTAKIAVLGVAMILLTRISWVDGPALGLSVIITAVVWLAAEMHAFVKLRIPVFAGTSPDGPAGPAGGKS
jgi:ATP synthase protein I